jgi:hypothetical protein
MTLPPLTDMVRADEYTLSLDQELRLLDDRRKRSRWWIAPEGTPAPGPRIDDSRTIAPGPVLTEPWLSPWTQLNDPARDDMVGVVIVDEADPGQGILIWVHPTAEARAAWQAAWDDPTWRPYALGCETGIRVDPDYRAVFRSVTPLRPIDDANVRWKFARPGFDIPAWEVMSAGWRPNGHGPTKPPTPREVAGELSAPEPTEERD